MLKAPTRLALLPALASLVLTSLLLTACGGGGDSPPISATTPASAPTPAPNPAPTPASCAATHPKVGQVATLRTLQHGVSGTVKVLDNCTLQVTNFNYDGGGLPDVFVYGGKGGDYAAGFAIGTNLFGTRQVNGTVTVALKDGDLDKLDGVSIWCVRARVSFGDGLLAAPR